MRTITKTLYRFDELPSDKAKERARDWCRSVNDYAWMDESRQSIEAFCEHFRVRLLDWSVGAFAPFHFRTDAEGKHFRGMRLRDFHRDHMPTGFCLDCSLWMTFFDRFKATGDAKLAFDDAVNEGFKDWRNDMEGQHEDEYIDDFLIGNEYEFDENGARA